MKLTRSCRRVHKAQGPPYNRVVDLLDLYLRTIGPLGPIDLLDLLRRGGCIKLGTYLAVSASRARDMGQNSVSRSARIKRGKESNRHKKHYED